MHIVLDSRMQPVVMYTCLPFRWTVPHLFSLLADDSCSPKIQNWLGNPFCTQLQGINKNVQIWSITSMKMDKYWRATGRANRGADDSLVEQKESIQISGRSSVFLFSFCFWHPLHLAGITFHADIIVRRACLFNSRDKLPLDEKIKLCRSGSTLDVNLQPRLWSDFNYQPVIEI